MIISIDISVDCKNFYFLGFESNDMHFILEASIMMIRNIRKNQNGNENNDDFRHTMMTTVVPSKLALGESDNCCHNQNENFIHDLYLRYSQFEKSSNNIFAKDIRCFQPLEMCSLDSS